MLTDFQDLWLTSRRGDLPKANEVQTINVAKTCETLRLAITQPRNGQQRNLDITRRNQANELTFRAVSCLCYTTLRVHELQVTDLLNRCQMLVAQSGSWSAIKLPAKRKSSQTVAYNASYQTKRKRNSIERSISVTDYTQLLDDTENFVEWSKSTEVINKTVSNVTKTNRRGSRTTCIHIREITINEVDTRHAEHYPSDEDEGFGNATADELSTLMRMMEDQNVTKSKGAKRKILETRSICDKRPKMVNANENSPVKNEEPEIEMARTAGVPDTHAMVHFSPIQINHDVSTLNESNVPEIADGVANRSDIDENDANSFEVLDNNSNGMSIENNNNEELSACPSVMGSVCYNKQKSLPITTRKQAKSKTKVIIDERVVLTGDDIRAQLQVKVNLRKTARKMRAKIKWNVNAQHNIPSRKHYERILPTANALLNTLNRSCIAMRKFKMKHRKASASSKTAVENSTTRSLLREILNRDINDDLVEEIFENSNRIEKNKGRSSLRLAAAVQEHPTTPPQVEDNYNLSPFAVNNKMTSDCINNNNNNVNIECIAENASTTTNEQDEYGTFDVMVKLLNLWRSTKVLGDEIYADFIFKPTEMLRKQAAKAFYALLKLAAQGFIVLQTAEKSKHLHGIKLGPASAKLIQKNDFNGKTAVKRRHNGYRIHAN